MCSNRCVYIYVFNYVYSVYMYSVTVYSYEHAHYYYYHIIIKPNSQHRKRSERSIFKPDDGLFDMIIIVCFV
jgi:hypothetical protein